MRALGSNLGHLNLAVSFAVRFASFWLYCSCDAAEVPEQSLWPVKVNCEFNNYARFGSLLARVVCL